MAAVCVAIFCLGQKGTRKKNISFPVRFRALRYSKPLKISKYPANAQEMKYFFTLVIDWNGFGEIIIRWKRGKK